MMVEEQEQQQQQQQQQHSRSSHGLRSRLFTHLKRIHIHDHSKTSSVDEFEPTIDSPIAEEHVTPPSNLTASASTSQDTSDTAATATNINDNKAPMEKSVPPPAMEKNQEMEQMKEKFAKLLLGEDMSGGGKGVSSALALSNAITNLAASVFGEQWKLEPMSPQRKARWRREIGWMLSVTDHIVEFVASQQGNMEIMVTRQRTDLRMNIPALRKLDAMLIDCLDNFKDQSEFSYVSRDAPDSEKGPKRKEEKWWLPTAKVPTNGLSDASRKFLQYQKDCVNQVLKAAMAINAQVLAEMEIPESYIESLPKNGRASLGDLIYKCITVEFFDPDQFLSTMELTSEHKILDLKDRIEASIVIWKRKMNQKDSKSGWGSAVSIEKREQFEERAETILLIIKQRFPGIPQSSLEISKIQFNKDVGHAILESYSRILESLAHTVLSRIEDVIYADQVAKNPGQAGKKRSPSQSETPGSEDKERTSIEAPSAMTLSDFMGWEGDQNDNDDEVTGTTDEMLKEDKKLSEKLANVVMRKTSYLDNLVGSRSPVHIRGEGCSKFADVYYAAPSGKKLRSIVEIQKYLADHPQYAQGLSMSQFSFQTPKPLQENYVRKRPPRITGQADNNPLLQPKEVTPLSIVGPDNINLELGMPSSLSAQEPASDDVGQPAKKQRTEWKDMYCDGSPAYKQQQAMIGEASQSVNDGLSL